MLNKKIWLGMLVLALSFNLTLMGCVDSEPEIEKVDKIVEVPAGGMIAQNVAKQETLVEALDWVKNNYMDFTNYIIDLKDYDSVSYIAPTTLDYPDVRAITLTLTNTGAAERTITLKKSGSGGSYATSDRGKLFTIKTGIYLVIDGKLTLKGIDATADGQSNNASLIDVAAGGGLVMKGQSKISGNTNSGSYGGGVYVEEYGVFIMQGGTITGNKVASSSSYVCGGVFVSSNGTFTMTGGSISDNTATTSSTYADVVVGGVYLSSGTFTMTGGSISGNTATGSVTVINGIYLSSSSSIFKVKGSPQITDTVGLYSYSTISAAITLNGAFAPTAAVPVDLLCYDATAYNSGSPTVWNNKAVLKWDAAYTGHPSTFPVDKFTLGKYLETGSSNSASITGKKIDSTSGQLVNE
jgi:hypothetical protein